MKCPRCDSPLRPVTQDEVQVHVCPDCQGEWLSSDELHSLVEHHNEIFTPEEIGAMAAVNQQMLTAEATNHDELECPHCEGVTMEHFNYGDTSGIILHKCTECDGIWTDKDQLQKVEAVVDGWKKALPQDSKKYDALLKKIEVQEQAEIDQNVSISKVGFVNAILRRFCE